MIIEFGLDMDGVLAAFDKYFIQRYGVGPASATSEMWDDFWSNAVANDNAFEQLDYEVGALEIWNFVISLAKQHPDRFKVSIITASGYGKSPTSPQQKFNWCKSHLPNFQPDMFNFVNRSEDKVNALKSKPDMVLIDDMLNNVKDWVDAGGYAIHYRHAETTINEIKSRFLS